MSRYTKLCFTICLEVHREGLSIRDCALRHAMSGGIDAAQKAYEHGMKRLGLSRTKSTITPDEVGLAVQRYEEQAARLESRYVSGTPAWFRDFLERERDDDELERVYRGD